MLQTVHFAAAQKIWETDKIERRVRTLQEIGRRANRKKNSTKTISMKSPSIQEHVAKIVALQKPTKSKESSAWEHFLLHCSSNRRIFCEGACKLQSRFDYFSEMMKLWKQRKRDHLSDVCHRNLLLVGFGKHRETHSGVTKHLRYVWNFRYSFSSSPLFIRTLNAISINIIEKPLRQLISIVF